MIREELLALADELEGMDCREGCSTCTADGTKDCRGDLSCEEAVAIAASRRIREIAEHGACEEAATTVSEYDLLPDEDLKALAWVREHGGLDAVEKLLMPEGMEWLLDVWPRWSNGEYCKFGDWWTADKYGDYKPKQLRMLVFYTPEQLREWGQDEGENFGYEWDCMRPSDTTYRPDKVEPPAPKVLDADGVEIRVCDTVWDVESGIEYEVVGIHTDEDTPVMVMRTDGSHLAKAAKPSTLTHERPVLDADGVPIKEGDTVYLLPGEWCDRFPCLWFYGGEELNVIGLNPKHGDICSIKCCKAGNMTCLCYPQSSQLTHTKPEPPDSRQAVVNEIGDEMAARIDLLVSSGRWSDAD